ncbi:MAG: IPT/TIG domain-containing protein [Bryobacteraceae bacterium]
MEKISTLRVYKLRAAVLFAAIGSLANAQILSVSNAASFVSNTTLTPGSIITIRGTNLTNVTAQAANPSGPPKTLGGVTITIGGAASNLWYVSPTQINAQIDPLVPVGQQTLLLTSPTGSFTKILTVEKAGAPGIFTLNGAGTRDGAIINAVTFQRGPFTVTTNGRPTFLAIYATGLDLSAQPVVRIDGVIVPLQFWGLAPGFIGLQQINVELLPSMAGAGRVEVSITAGGKTSNVVEIVILPNPGQGEFPTRSENSGRGREIASLAYIPATSLVLLTDENDDVVRVIDVRRRAVVRTITLRDGAEPVAIAVNEAATLAVVAERERDRIAIIDLTTFQVLGEVVVGGGPSSVATIGNLAVVVNQDTDNVTVVNLLTRQVTAAIAVGRSPRDVSIDPIAGRAYVTNQSDGTVSVVNLANGTVVDTFNLGANSRPSSILVVPLLGIALISEPSGHNEGKVVVMLLATGGIVGSLNVNPDKSGGSGDIVFNGTNVFFANQSGGSVTTARLTGIGTNLSPTSIKVGLGARALAIDTLDNVLLVSNQGSGNVVLIDLNTNRVIARINAVRSENEEEDDDRDNRNDREKAANMPQISSISPKSGRANSTFTITINGTGLRGVTEVMFVDPDSLPGKGKGGGNSGKNNHGPFGQTDKGLKASIVQVNAAGTQLTASVTIASGTDKGDRIVRVDTPNGESTFAQSPANTFNVE